MERAPHLPHKAKSLVTADARITAYSGGEVEVYDRRNDSNELNNLGVTDAEGALVADMKQKLLDSLIRYSDMARLNAD
jgi:hypothetical protein